MIEIDDDDRAQVDAAIRDSLERLARRSSALGDGARALADAAAAAGVDG